MESRTQFIALKELLAASTFSVKHNAQLEKYSHNFLGLPKKNFFLF
jgi:hypothetical protein